MPTSRALPLGVIVATVTMVASVLSLPANAEPSLAGSVIRVVDGDTIEAGVGSGTERVRFLNIDTPEVGTCMADRATAFTERQLPAGREVQLRVDRDRRDPYDRLLALVKPTGGEWLSVSLAERGLGFPLAIAPNTRYYPRVVAAASRAERQGVGMFDPRRSCTPVSRARRASTLTSEAQAMPVRSRTQYRAAMGKLDKAAALLTLVTAARYGATASSWFTSYARGLRVPAQKRVRAVRAAKTRQWHAAANASNNGGSGTNGGSGNNGSTSSNNSHDGWWPPGVPHSYNGPRCYQPGGVVWYPC
ncbi:hypothetical protein HN031_03545 [Nocardioides sp. zg-1308]|uniref:thermonuclease family protein n=1 Tax=Nocardioides sp. zg-1308 TaxID=2736253 RepID=UPI0015551858|nr:thermonuclease family protein [Nocardioides sp. zg-1308]NPD03757.1 hypothetical protein [Nocardioides sp. zg-1308]